jgi:FADH2 O2-dependent halogenase
MTLDCEVAIVGSGFAGSLLARVLAVQGSDVLLLERGTHPRFAIGESTTPLANLSLERIATRYGLRDCYRLAAHGRWTAHYPELRRGLKRGFSYYRHHPGEAFADRGLDSERLLVAASPEDAIADVHWMRSDVDAHFVREAIAAGVEYRDRVELTHASFDDGGASLRGARFGEPMEIRATFVVDASGPAGFLARQLSIPSGLERTRTRAGLVFSHFDDVRTMRDLLPSLPAGPYPEDWAAVHHIIDEGWMYSLRFDDGATSAGFLLTPRGVASLGDEATNGAERLWATLLERYPTIGAAFAEATPTMPIAWLPGIQHRLTRAVGARWALLPHAYAFVDPLFSTGIAWGLRAVERLGLMFEDAASRERVPAAAMLERYANALAAEADQVDTLVAGAYEAMAQFDLFAAQAMLYFASVSFAEVGQRIAPDETVAWRGFLGVGDPVLEPLFGESLRRLCQITGGCGDAGMGGCGTAPFISSAECRAYAEWMASAIASRNVAGLADPARHNMYPVDLELLVERHALLGMTRERLMESLPALRGMSPEPSFPPASRANGGSADPSTSLGMTLPVVLNEGSEPREMHS